jgi:hypothetical protein
MLDPQELRSLARKCRMMTGPSLQPSVNKQLWLWAAELADYADEIERRSEIHKASWPSPRRRRSDESRAARRRRAG